MIVSHRHRFVFFAVPRTGSHAVHAALRPLLGPEDWEQEGLEGAVDAADFRELMLLRPQTGLLMDEAGRLGMDFLGRYETLQDSFREACQRIGIPEQQLAVVNATAHRPWEDCYDDEARTLATGFYRRDFEMLDYSPAIGPREPG